MEYEMIEPNEMTPNELYDLLGEIEGKPRAKLLRPKEIHQFIRRRMLEHTALPFPSPVERTRRRIIRFSSLVTWVFFDINEKPAEVSELAQYRLMLRA